MTPSAGPGGARSWAAALALVLLVAAAGPAAAQDVTATLTGTVTDHKGHALAGVTVSVKNAATGVSKDVVTNALGLYTASFLHPGRYAVTFALDGLRTRTVTKVQLRANDRRQLDVVLKPGGAKKPPPR